MKTINKVYCVPDFQHLQDIPLDQGNLSFQGTQEVLVVQSCLEHQCCLSSLANQASHQVLYHLVLPLGPLDL